MRLADNEHTSLFIYLLTLIILIIIYNSAVLMTMIDRYIYSNLFNLVIGYLSLIFIHTLFYNSWAIIHCCHP